MFCPTCGREASPERKFCPTCGTNLERVTKALSPVADGLLPRADQAFDRLVARYASLFFSDAGDKALDWRVSHSWRIWGQALLTSPANFILLWIMTFVILPLRLFTLLLYSPFRLLWERSNRQNAAPVAKVENRRAQLQAPPQGQWLMDSVSSAVEHTTMNLPDTAATERKMSRN